VESRACAAGSQGIRQSGDRAIEIAARDGKARLRGLNAVDCTAR